MASPRDRGKPIHTWAVRGEGKPSVMLLRIAHTSVTLYRRINSAGYVVYSMPCTFTCDIQNLCIRI